MAGCCAENNLYGMPAESALSPVKNILHLGITQFKNTWTQNGEKRLSSDETKIILANEKTESNTNLD